MGFASDHKDNLKQSCPGAKKLTTIQSRPDRSTLQSQRQWRNQGDPPIAFASPCVRLRGPLRRFAFVFLANSMTRPAKESCLKRDVFATGNIEAAGKEAT